MKLSYNTLLYEANELEIAINDCAKAGYQGIEINPVLWGAKKQTFVENIKKLKEKLINANIETACIMAGWLDRKEILKEIKTASETAVLLDAKLIGVLPPRRKRMGWVDFIKLLEESCRITKDYDLELTVHYHGGAMVENPEEIESMLEAAPRAKLLFDIAHYAHYAPSRDVIEGIRKFKDSIGYVHIKDIAPGKNFDYVIEELSNPPSNMDAIFTYGRSFVDLGKGILNIKEILKEFSKFYQGWITIEIENLRMDRFEHARYNLDYAKKILKEIKNEISF